jgi:hypothetical protein
VSIRGGRPPDSRRAIADWVVPVSSASSCWESPCAFALLGDLLRYLREEPALIRVDVREPGAQLLEGVSTHIAGVL